MAETKSTKTGATKTVVKKTASLSVTLYNIEGKEKGVVSLPKEIFASPAKPTLLAQAIRVYHANQRQGTAKTKTRSEVIGSTRKIYRQKGTGRARHGAIKAPIFVGGGIAHGPRPRSYTMSINKNQKQKAFFGALTLMAKDNEITALEDGVIDKVGKTKVVYGFLKKLELVGKRVVFVMPTKEKKPFVKAARNIERVELVDAASLNAYQVLKGGRLVFLESAITKLKEHFLKA